MKVFMSKLRTLFMKVLVTLVETVLTGKLFHTRRKRNVKYSFRQNGISKRFLWPRKLIDNKLYNMIRLNQTRYALCRLRDYRLDLYQP